MAELYEGDLLEALSLYDWDYSNSPSVKRAIRSMNYYLDGNGDYGPISGLNSADGIVHVTLYHFAYWVMAAREPRAPMLDLAQRMQFLAQVGRKFRFDENPQHLTPSLPEYGETILQLIATGRDDLLGPTEQIALGVLQSGRYVKREGTGGFFIQPSKIGVFALEALAATRNETIDWESFHVPPDRFWLDCARVGVTEPDPAKAAQWGHDLCEAHLNTLQRDVDNGTMTAATGHEINAEAHFLWPITVHAFLRLRAQLGLQTAEIDHPLMRTSFAIMRDWTMPAGAWQIEPWFTEILDKTVSAAPSLTPQVDLIR